MKYLVVIDMQNDFVSGSLGSAEAAAILPALEEKIRNFDGEVFFTRDTHSEGYLSTQEGKNLPVVHCVKGSEGWEIVPELEKLREANTMPAFDKPTFGSVALAEAFSELSKKEEIEEIELCGVCTDICVISNAMLIKAFLPEVPVSVDAACCAGTSPEAHENALNAMKMCQITVRG